MGYVQGKATGHMDCYFYERKFRCRLVVWTQKEKRELNNPYFKLLKVTEEYYELQSKNTGHLWIIKKQSFGHHRIILYHKHADKKPYYHKQCCTYTVKKAINIIERHDSYILHIYGGKRLTKIDGT